jgi:hypothetical protein
MYHEIATAILLDEVGKRRRKEIIEAVYMTGLSWDEVLTDEELVRLRKLHIEESPK